MINKLRAQTTIHFWTKQQVFPVAKRPKSNGRTSDKNGVEPNPPRGSRADEHDGFECRVLNSTSGKLDGDGLKKAGVSF